ncbi:hypothetical protein HPB52_025161 [Rhipicephalus sanguineus]|uniref:Uncharacterized protein n=1 Tax=Rhipicephalus sanguineus TaxID=34632 RepID=A0A9D4YRL9_RHISA|nr:hypothetical protein HPB52_025161 [Rhipicephalus sanguineus]
MERVIYRMAHEPNFRAARLPPNIGVTRPCLCAADVPTTRQPLIISPVCPSSLPPGKTAWPTELPAGVPPGFEHLFDGELGLVRDYVHRVKRRPDVPVSAKLRRLLLALRQQVASELRRLQDDDVIVDGRGRRPHSKAQISSAQSLSPESDANGSSASAPGSCNQPSSGREWGQVFEVGSRRPPHAETSCRAWVTPPQRTRKPPATSRTTSD